MAFEEAPENDASHKCQRQSGPTNGTGNALNAFAQNIATLTENARPHDAARRVPHEETKR
jgi:hypothetical protein